jgi:hypothetical protein
MEVSQHIKSRTTIGTSSPTLSKGNQLFWKDIYNPSLIAALFTIAKIGKSL